MIWQYLEKGLAAGAWVDGLIVSLAIMGALLWLFCSAMGWAFGGKEDEDK